jgi:hypothetical protein
VFQCVINLLRCGLAYYGIHYESKSLYLFPCGELSYRWLFRLIQPRINNRRIHNFQVYISMVVVYFWSESRATIGNALEDCDRINLRVHFEGITWWPSRMHLYELTMSTAMCTWSLVKNCLTNSIGKEWSREFTDVSWCKYKGNIYINTKLGMK